MSDDIRDILADFVEAELGTDHPYAFVDRLLRHLRDNELEIQMNEDGLPGAFVLVRDVDETGVSGTGLVAEGVEFTDGTVALRWTSAWPTSVVFHERGIDSVKHVHGHGGKTRIEWVGSYIP